MLPEALGVSPPAASQLVDRLAEHGMVERRHVPDDRRVMFVDYVFGIQEVARRMMEERRWRVEEALSSLTYEEARAFLKGLKLLVESFEVVEREKAR